MTVTDQVHPPAAGLCGCGCGLPTPIAKKQRVARGHVKGQPTPFRPSHRRRNPNVYKATWFHARPNNEGVVQVHIVVVEKALGHRLPLRAETHHVDGNKHNNANRNLVICQDHAYHALLHLRTRVVKAGGNPNLEKCCAGCDHPKPFAAFPRRNTKGCTYGLDNYCRECKRRKFSAWYYARRDRGRHRGSLVLTSRETESSTNTT